MTAQPTHRPFRFGVQSRVGASRQGWAAFVRRVEDLGYSNMTMPDHLDQQLGPIAGLMAAADATTRLRVGHLVLANDFRHPAILAKELATLDLLSDGRLDIALGAGHDQLDFQAAGIRMDRPGERIDRLIEALDILYGLFGPQPFSYAGTHYQVDDLNGYPKPMQRHVPLLIGAGGTRMLRLAAKRADIIGINGTMIPGPPPAGVRTSDLPIPNISHASWLSMSAGEIDAKVNVVREAAASRISEIELSVRAYLTHVSPDGDAVQKRLADELEVDLDFVRESPFILVGSLAQITEALHERRERWGFTHVMVGAAEVESFAPVIEALK
jgi:probable F420-dependent oxidoreductase